MNYDEKLFKEKANRKARKIWFSYLPIMVLTFPRGCTVPVII